MQIIRSGPLGPGPGQKGQIGMDAENLVSFVVKWDIFKHNQMIK